MLDSYPLRKGRCVWQPSNPNPSAQRCQPLLQATPHSSAARHKLRPHHPVGFWVPLVATLGSHTLRYRA